MDPVRLTADHLRILVDSTDSPHTQWDLWSKTGLPFGRGRFSCPLWRSFATVGDTGATQGGWLNPESRT